ncbi:hypothetical protein DB895_02820 [Flavobacterium psychrotolerans]|uniref:Uncharacterized protein n=2 Tax=Flavobacterium psychrotolerans TaxID=2169410 RepID=A0A2U1JP27_9FLAO|nr:hypothetical protein DB895_02820 [Flavobacterium psychrotolerans]
MIRKVILFFVFIVLNSCVGIRPSVQITDYVLVPNGKEIIGNNNLTAFIFENNVKKLPIEQFLSARFKTDNYLQNEFWITIDKERYKIIIYDKADFEKYFINSNFAVVNQEPENARSNDQRKFIAISMINSSNEDCLKDGSLFQNIAVTYLKSLKDEFYNQ